MKKMIWFVGIMFVILALMSPSAFSWVDTRLLCVSNSGGKLVFNVQVSAINTNDYLTSWQHSIWMDDDLWDQYTSHSFSHQGSGWFVITGQTETGSPAASSIINFQYTYDGTKEAVGDWLTIVTITINYTQADKQGSIEWGDDGHVQTH